MDERLAFTHPGRDGRVSRGRIAFSERGISCWNTARSDGTGLLAIDDGHEAEGCPAQSHRLFEHCVEHWDEIARRGVDDLQYLGGRRLLLQSLTRLIDEPRVLDRDDGLSRKIFQKNDLLVGEWPHLLPIASNK